MIKNSNIDKLNDKWIIWKHETTNTNWKLESFINIWEVNTIEDFWKFFSNLNSVNFKTNTIYFMRNGITPLWEDVKNRNGGTCSIRIENNVAIKYITDIGVYVVNELFLENDNNKEINGFSIVSYGNWAYIKILNKNKEINPSEHLNKDIKDKISEFSILYKENKPEY